MTVVCDSTCSEFQILKWNCEEVYCAHRSQNKATSLKKHTPWEEPPLVLQQVLSVRVPQGKPISAQMAALALLICVSAGGWPVWQPIHCYFFPCVRLRSECLTGELKVLRSPGTCDKHAWDIVSKRGLSMRLTLPSNCNFNSEGFSR